MWAEAGRREGRDGGRRGVEVWMSEERGERVEVGIKDEKKKKEREMRKREYWHGGSKNKSKDAKGRHEGRQEEGK